MIDCSSTYQTVYVLKVGRME